MLAKKTVKNQITLPKSILDKIPDTDYFEVSLPASRLGRVRAKIKALGLTEKDIGEAIRWARGR
jgi:hypothetical protein